MKPFTRAAGREDTRRRGRGWGTTLLSALSAAGLVLVSLVALPHAAMAAPNTTIVVDQPTLTTVGGGQATVGDTLRFSGSWDASAAHPQPGDSFTIGLPAELGFGAAIPFPLVGLDSGGTQRTWANCLTDPATKLATCVLTAEVANNSESVKGTFTFDVKAEVATTAVELQFQLNGTPVMVPLPGGGGIDDGVVVPTQWAKSGALNGDKSSMTWKIELPGARMAASATIHVIERLSANHVLCTPSGLKVETVRGSTVVDVTSLGAIDANVTAPDDFGITLTAPGGGFDKNVTYRITYRTCTPNGQIDPEGTTYTNDATVTAWGESSGEIGVTQDWTIPATVSKGGEVLGGSERDAKMRWTVTVPGRMLFGKSAFTLIEQLSGSHAVCSDTVSGIRVWERYGPSWSRQTEITGKLAATPMSSTAQAFTANIAIADPGFAFQDNDWMYLIQYTTCGTGAGLPASGTGFGNTVSVDGNIATGTATVPNRNEGKGGDLNGSATDVDGVTYLPQTTMNWRVVVPGQNVDGVTTPLTVTDTLSATQGVCGAPADGPVAASRLNLKVEARDQIDGGGLAPQDLTAQTTVAKNGNVFTLSIAAPSLPLPGGGSTAGAFSREYQYVVTYTTCTTSGGMDAPNTQYSNTAEVAGKQYSRQVSQQNHGSGTGTGMPRGTVSVSKALAETAGATFVPADTEYSVHVKEIDPTGTVQAEYDLTVTAGGAPASGFNARGTGWTIELSEPTLPVVPGVSFGTPRFAAGPGVSVSADGSVATATLTPATNVAVSLTNTALLGSAHISKSVTGAASALVDAHKSYTLTAKIDTSALGAGFPAQPDRLVTVTTGTPATLGDLPVGATVRLAEQQPTNDDVLTWGTPTITPAEFVVSASDVTTPAQVAVVNSVERTVGTFSLSKRVDGSQAANGAVPATVRVSAAWQEQGGTAKTKNFDLPTNGTSVPFGENLLIGTAVTLTETVPANGSGIAWGAPVWTGDNVAVQGSGAVVTIDRNAAAQVTVTNHAATSTAGIRIVKGVAGAAAGEVPASTTFPVVATWTDADGNPQRRNLTISTAEPTPLGVSLPAGTVVTLTEGERPVFPTVVWKSIAISGTGVADRGEGTATVTVSALQGDSTLVTVVNEATWAPGSFSIAKTVTGIAATDPEVPPTVTVRASWSEGEARRSADLAVPTDGTVTRFPQDIARGTVVTLTEEPLAGTARFTWAAPGWSGDAVTRGEDGSATVVIGAAQVATVSLTNRAVETTGILAFTKSVTGNGADSVPAGTTFPVKVSWTDLVGATQERHLSLTPGVVATIDGVPHGTALHVEEAEALLPSAVRWTGATWSTVDTTATLTTDRGSRIAAVTLVGDAGARASLSLQNDIVLQPKLAVTGTDPLATAVVVGGGLLALLIGALLVIRVRRSASRRPTLR